MKWIKAIERLPDDFKPDELLHVKYLNHKGMKVPWVCTYDSSVKEFVFEDLLPVSEKDFYKIEWLDESDDTPAKGEGKDDWVDSSKPPENMKAVLIAAKYGKVLQTCSDTAYFKDGKWFDNSNDFQLVDGFVKYWRLRPTPPKK